MQFFCEEVFGSGGFNFLMLTFRLPHGKKHTKFQSSPQVLRQGQNSPLRIFRQLPSFDLSFKEKAFLDTDLSTVYFYDFGNRRQYGCYESQRPKVVDLPVSVESMHEWVKIRGKNRAPISSEMVAHPRQFSSELVAGSWGSATAHLTRYRGSLATIWGCAPTFPLLSTQISHFPIRQIDQLARSLHPKI